jgi:hypothetical protein
MSVFYSSNVSAKSVWPRALVRRLRSALGIFHRGIVKAKMRRLETEAALREIPRCPMVLGDKWDF